MNNNAMYKKGYVITSLFYMAIFFYLPGFNNKTTTESVEKTLNQCLTT